MALNYKIYVRNDVKLVRHDLLLVHKDIHLLEHVHGASRMMENNIKKSAATFVNLYMANHPLWL